MTPPSQRPPAWFTVVTVVMMLPLIAWPKIVTDMLDIMGKSEDNTSTLVFIFPLYALLSAWLAYRSYTRRPELSWILLGVLLLAYGAMAFLISHNPQL